MQAFLAWVRAVFRRPESPPSEVSHARVATIVEYMNERRRPCLRLTATIAGGRSRLGGLPPAIAEMEWPHFEGRPLSFLAEISLAEVRDAGGPDWLPDWGRLLFFIDTKGFDWKGSWTVIHIPDQVGKESMAAPSNLPRKRQYRERPVGFIPAASYPLYERSWDVICDASEVEFATVEAALGVAEPRGPEHQIGGYPRPIQSDFMEAECQHALNQDFGAAPPISPEVRADRAPAGVQDWRLLMQLDSDDEMGATWWDGGTLYFWIREQDARAGDFSRMWAIMQCY